ncbi:uncharacterized protein K452DRAFT_351978 [Aplosporella prunicola CBS 121167]|uniref:Rhodopsin domain-containing protein n=1 Tax=Aplosporella prunicola CBS 121167 TaxID=1176127 RepID=A0A6A6BCG6_9PEZI|nr:uncharacterized protein K452DRAFT_351978 [Aplosporella prunicola CBS 121167]KAF2140161.1 hypothetical protein K452DRAFT_351978 [Aplosporella prunicola CBS 121167]
MNHTFIVAKVPKQNSPMLYSPKNTKPEAMGVIKVDWQALTPTIVLTTLALVAVALRFYTRAVLARRVMVEDWCILFSLTLSIAMASLISVEFHVATAGWETEKAALAVLSKLTLAQLILTSNVLYQTLVNVTKTAFVLQYLRIFQYRLSKIFCIVLLIILLGAACWGVFGSIFICRPFFKYWKPGVEGRCMNINSYWLSTACIGVIMDFVVWFYPMPLISSLRLPMRQKASVMGVFALGGFVCIVSILRLALVQIYAAKQQTEKSGATLIVWSAVEANVGIICASLMALKPLLAKFFPRFLDVRRSSKKHLKLRTMSQQDSCGFWGHTCDTRCAASSRDSRVPPPAAVESILITRNTLLREDISREDIEFLKRQDTMLEEGSEDHVRGLTLGPFLSENGSSTV